MTDCMTNFSLANIIWVHSRSGLLPLLTMLCSLTADACPIPVLPQGVLFESDSGKLKCKAGFVPTDQFTAVCGRAGTWFPNPADFNCSG